MLKLTLCHVKIRSAERLGTDLGEEVKKSADRVVELRDQYFNGRM